MKLSIIDKLELSTISIGIPSALLFNKIVARIFLHYAKIDISKESLDQIFNSIKHLRKVYSSFTLLEVDTETEKITLTL